MVEEFKEPSENSQTPQDPKAEKFLTGKYAGQPRNDVTDWKRRLIIAGIVLLALALVAAFTYFVFLKKDSPAAVPEEQIQGSEEPAETNSFRDDPNTVHMLATGDFIAHDAINQEAKTSDGYDYAKMMAPMKEVFDDYNVNFCNQATPAGGESFGVSGYPVFNAPFAWSRDMAGMGCNVINVGTNHTNDKGQRVISAMLDEWDKHDTLAVAGANRSTEEQQKVRYFESKGVKFAFVSYSTYTNIANPNPYSLNMFRDDLVNAQLEEANEQADIVIVSMRWGTEYSEEVNNAQKQQAQILADKGADIILGHGTHTLQPVEKLTGASGNETIVWYGLGNFLNAQLETTGLTGCVAQIDIDVATKAVKSTSCLPFYQHYEWTAEEKAVEKLLARKNFLIMPLFDAADYMAKSQMKSTVEEQMERIRMLVNTYMEVPVQNARDM